jgi:hypothetical protein
MPLARREVLVRAEMSAPRGYHLNRETALTRGMAIDEWFKKCLSDRQPYGPPHPVERHCRRLVPLVRAILKSDSQIWTDEIVYSAAMGVAGTLDVVATLPSNLRAVIELKSSAYTIWPEAVAEALLQAAAYFALWNHLHPEFPLDAIATYHVTPYRVHEQVISTAPALAQAIAGWSARKKQFAARYSQMEL